MIAHGPFPFRSPVPLMDHGDDAPLLCPVCGANSVRPVSVYCLPDGRVGSDAEGIHIEPRAGQAGMDVLIAFQGKCGHWFAYGFGMCDGGTVVELSCSAREDKAERCAR